MRTVRLLVFLCVGFLVLPEVLFAQTSVPFSSDQWTFGGQVHSTETHLGRESLRLKGASATLGDVAFTEGIIEFDIAFSSARNFVGTFWRMADGTNYEEFYMRPHQSGNPDANQYTPVFNGIPGWQLYHGAGHGAPTIYRFNEWMAVRLVIARDHAEIYIQDMDTPALVTANFKRDRVAGPIGIYAAGLADAHFANFRYTQMANPPLKGTPPDIAEAPTGSIMSWEVSSPFPENSLGHTLTSDDKSGLEWKTLASEATGTANVGKIIAGTQENNTVFVRMTLESSRAQVIPLQFGYIDRVRVYLNDKALYQGLNTFQSRDYRFLGTIGLFDTVYLDLKEGTNEVWMAVTAHFGGWGVKAVLPSADGVTVR